MLNKKGKLHNKKAENNVQKQKTKFILIYFKFSLILQNPNKLTK